MSLVSSANQALIQSGKTNTKLYLSIYQPTTMLACQVNDATISKGTRDITYDSVSSGGYLNVVAGMTLLVGTSAGDDSKGRIRVKSADATTITVAENSHINWADDDYLTVVNYFEINPVYPRYVQDEDDKTIVTVYKDYDVAYTDQNTYLGTMINMGGHYAGFLDSSSHQIYYSASGTTNFDGEGLSYEWVFEGATVTGSTSETPGYITYDTAGHYKTTLLVSGTNTNDRSYRHISIYDRPEDGTNNPILNWELKDFGGDRSKGTYNGKIVIHETIDSTILKDGSLVVIFSEDWYNGTKTSIGGNRENRESIFFVGYVINGTISYNYRESSVEFEIGSATEIMKLAEGYSISTEDSVNPGQQATDDDDYPSGWFLLKAQTVNRAIFHYLRWHTTALNCVDFRFVGTDQNIEYFDADRESLFDALQNLLGGALLGNTVSDRQGAVYFESPIWSSAESANFQTNFGLSNRDWVNDVVFTQIGSNEVSYVELGGIAWSGSVTGTMDAFITDVPGTAPNYRGETVRRQGLALTTQGQLNTLGGDYYAHLNAKYPDLFMSMAGSYRNLDIAPQENIPITVNSTDNVRGISFSNKNFYPTSIKYDYLSDKEFLRTDITFREVTSGFAGDTVAIPPVPTEGETGGSFSAPTFEIPPLPTINIGGFYAQSVFSPVTMATLGDTAKYEEYWGGAGLDGWIMSDTVQMDTWGWFYIPPGVTSYQLYFCLHAPLGQPAGNAYLELGTYVYANDWSDNYISVTRTWVTDGGNQLQSFPATTSPNSSRAALWYGGTTQFPSVSTGHLGEWVFTRAGDVGADDYTHFYIYGAVIVFNF